jgi:uncharacterized membrane protein
MRGFVMLLMAIDHASEMFNGGRISTDSAYVAGPHAIATGVGQIQAALPLDQFLTRWITHLCAPTFLFLTGTSLALSTESRRNRGDTPGAIDLHLLIRALVLLAFELLLSTLAGGFGFVFLQVLYAIACGIVAMIPLRRFPTSWLVAVALFWMLAGEAITRAIVLPGEPVPLAAGLTTVSATMPGVFVLYPAIPWLAMLLLGWAFGNHLRGLRGAASKWSPERICLFGGAGALVLFAGVRGWNGYGNMLLPRADSSLAQWLHVSKYPPSLSFTALELGIMGVLLSGLFAYERRRNREPRRAAPLLVFGQTALFFYVLHFLLLGGAAQLFGWSGAGGLREAYVGALAVSVLLYPLCLWYRAYKAAHPRGWPQYL